MDASGDQSTQRIPARPLPGKGYPTPITFATRKIVTARASGVRGSAKLHCPQASHLPWRCDQDAPECALLRVAQSFDRPPPPPMRITSSLHAGH